MIIQPWLLYSFAFIMNSATGVMVIVMPLLAIRFGASPFELGLLGSVGSLAYTLACPLAGFLSDAHAVRGDSGSAWGRRRSLVLSCVLLICVDLCILFASGLRDVFIMAVCGCFCTAFFWPPLQAWFSESGARAELPERLGLFNLSWSTGIMMGPMIGGYLYTLHYRLPWYYAVAANFAVLVMLLMLRAVPPAGGAAPAPQDTPVEQRDPGAFLPLALWANFACWFALANVQSLYPKYALAAGFSPAMLGYLLFLVGATQSAFFVILRAYPFWHFRHVPLILAHAAAACGMLIVFRSSSVPLLSLAFPLLGCALGLSYYSSIYYSLCVRGAVGRRTGVHEFMVGSGFLVGPLVGGLLAQYLSLRSPFLMCALLLMGTSAWEAAAWIRSARGRGPCPRACDVV